MSRMGCWNISSGSTPMLVQNHLRLIEKFGLTVEQLKWFAT
jgi:hypothetical protein